MASSVWKGYISFGLISVPIRMYVAAREQHISFNQVHASCGTRIKQQLWCPTDERVVDRDEIVKGYPAPDGGYVTVTNDELKHLEAQSSQTMSIVQFVQLEEVDPLYYESSYYTVAEEPGRRAYALMMQGMAHLKLGAIANITLHQREQVVMIRPYAHGLVLHTLYYPEEVRELDEYGAQEELALQPQEVALAEQFMQQLASPFHPDAFTNTYQERVEQLIASKTAGVPEPDVEAPKKPAGQVVSLMDALRKSIQDREAKAGVKPIRAESPAEAEEAKAVAEEKPAPKSRRKKAS